MKRSLVGLTLCVGAVVVYACGGSSATDSLIGDADSGTGSDSGLAVDTGVSIDGTAGGGDGGGGVQDASADSALDSGLSCTKPMANCSGKAADGCSVNTDTDPLNCGGCGINCSAGACKAGVCQLLSMDAGALPATGDGACMAIDTNYVYWATARAAANGGAIYRVPLNGGAWSLVIANQDFPRGIASDGTNLYWTNAGAGTVVRSALDGSNPVTIASGQQGPAYLVLDATNVYWLNGGNTTVGRQAKNAASTAGAVIMANGLSGGGQVAPFNSLAVVGANAYYTDLNVGGGGPKGNIMRIATSSSGVNPTSIQAGLQRPWGISSDGTSLYFSTAGNLGQANGEINKIPLAGGATPVSLASGLATPTAIVVNGSYAYFDTTVAGGGIAKVPLAGGAVVPLAQNQSFPGCMAVDATSVYWINNGAFTLNKTAK